MYLGRMYGKCVTREGPICREGAPFMVSGAFAAALSWMRIRIRCPNIYKAKEVNQIVVKKRRGLDMDNNCLIPILKVFNA